MGGEQRYCEHQKLQGLASRNGTFFICEANYRRNVQSRPAAEGTPCFVNSSILPWGGVRVTSSNRRTGKVSPEDQIDGSTSMQTVFSAGIILDIDFQRSRCKTCETNPMKHSGEIKESSATLCAQRRSSFVSCHNSAWFSVFMQRV